METKSNNRGDPQAESLSDAARRLLAGLSARKYRAAGNGQAAPILDRLSSSQAERRLGQSEEKNRRQSPQRVADNDNGRKRPREKQTQNLLPRSRDELPWEERHGWGKSGCTGSVLRPFAIDMKGAVHRYRGDTFTTDRAEFEDSTPSADFE